MRGLHRAEDEPAGAARLCGTGSHRPGTRPLERPIALLGLHDHQARLQTSLSALPIFSSKHT